MVYGLKFAVIFDGGGRQSRPFNVVIAVNPAKCKHFAAA
jgi:hypothetical protein